MKQYLIIAAVILGIAVLPLSSDSDQMLVGSKKFTESVILGELLRQLADHAELSVGHLRELGGTQVLYQALKNGEIAGYVEYTGTIDQEILSGRSIMDSAQRATALAADGIAISQGLGFSNTYALAMTSARAKQLGIASISDLARHPQLRYGISNEFLDRADGWPGLRDRYQLAATNVYGTDHDLAYRQIQSGEIDVIDAYTTDARIEPHDLVLLHDDRQFFPRYEAVILYSASLAHRYPELLAAWKLLEGKVNEATMSQLNAAVELDQAEESQVAARFLRHRLQVQAQAQTPSPAQRMTRHTWEHLDLVRRSLLPAILAAVPLGIVASKFRWLGQAVLAVTGVIQTVPALALLVMLMPVANWMGLQSIGKGSATAIMALFLYSLLPIVRNTVAGLHDVPLHLREAASALGLSDFWRLNHVELPLATRTILAGIKTAAVLNIGYATLGALIGAGGLGQPILTGIRLNRFNLILEGAIPAALLALIAQGLFELLERWAIPRGLRLQAKK
jgi:osmoprotectant transport system permease protein